jgi:hypothetical protein
LAEWLGSGLQSRLQQFESARRLYQIRTAGQTRWATLVTIPLTATSQFTYTTRFARLGSYTVRASYGGDAGHLPSVATAPIRITS